MELSDVNIEMPVKVQGKQVNEVEGSEPYTGRIARSLHPSLVVKELDTGADGTITMEAVKKQTEDPLDGIDRIKSAAEQEGRGLNFDEEDEIKLLEEKAKIKQEEDGMRYPMLKNVDHDALNRIGNHADLDAYKRNVLLPNEELITELSVVAFEGLVTKSTELKVGNGVLMASRLPRDDGSFVHRLHFYIDDKDSTFKAKQRYWNSNLLNENAQAEAEQFILAKHELTGAFSSAFVEENLVHIHSEVTETSRLAERIVGTVGKGPTCCQTLCAQCHHYCKYLTCEYCCSLLPQCCAEYSAVWEMDVRSQGRAEKLAMLLMEPYESRKEDLTVKMPFEKMEREISNSTGTSAGVVKTTHTVHITMRNSATNRVEAGTAVVAPTASIADIIKFESLMQSLSVEGSYKGSENSIEKGKTVQTWSSGAATSILSAFGGGSSVLGSGESAFGGGAVRSLASRGDKKPFGNTSMMTIFADICAFGACDCTDIKPGYKIKQETCCVVWEACCALDEAPYPIGFMQTEEGEIMKFGYGLGAYTLVQPRTCVEARSHMLIFKNATAFPCSDDVLPAPVCAVYGCQCFPNPGCCVHPYPAGKVPSSVL